MTLAFLVARAPLTASETIGVNYDAINSMPSTPLSSYTVQSGSVDADGYMDAETGTEVIYDTPIQRGQSVQIHVLRDWLVDVDGKLQLTLNPDGNPNPNPNPLVPPPNPNTNPRISRKAVSVQPGAHAYIFCIQRYYEIL